MSVALYAFVAGAAFGAFITVLVLVASDAHRFDGSVSPRRRIGAAARYGVRVRMLRVSQHPQREARRAWTDRAAAALTRDAS